MRRPGLGLCVCIVMLVASAIGLRWMFSQPTDRLERELRELGYELTSATQDSKNAEGRLLEAQVWQKPNAPQVALSSESSGTQQVSSIIFGPDGKYDQFLCYPNPSDSLSAGLAKTTELRNGIAAGSAQLKPFPHGGFMEAVLGDSATKCYVHPHN